MNMKNNIQYIFALGLIAILSISCNKKQVSNSPSDPAKKQAFDYPPEPADPDKYDMSVWGKVNPGIHSGFGSADRTYSKSIPPAGEISESIKLSGWKGERVNCKVLVWSSEKEEPISIETNDFKSKNGSIRKDCISISVMQYVLVDQFLNEKKYPAA